MYRKTFILILLLFLTRNVSAQLHISTESIIEGIWNDNTKGWDETQSEIQYLSFFEFTDSNKIIKHTTPDYVSAYLIESFDVDDNKDKWEFSLLSDKGARILAIFDFKKEYIRFIYEIEGETNLSQFYIKDVWVDE